MDPNLNGLLVVPSLSQDGDQLAHVVGDLTIGAREHPNKVGASDDADHSPTLDDRKAVYPMLDHPFNGDRHGPVTLRVLTYGGGGPWADPPNERVIAA
ncbi:MAG: hypothetical protein QOD44_4214 [Solirubrobacteraceae bacterium]|nr:hypothetical protein [Solirubrobacteraceae bacterium]